MYIHTLQSLLTVTLRKSNVAVKILYILMKILRGKSPVNILCFPLPCLITGGSPAF